jgi:3-methylcrotonyl-CoA carboxylase alpha subunit
MAFVTVTVDGETFEVVVEAASPPVYRVRCNGGGLETLHCVAAGPILHLFWRGRAYRIDREPSSRARVGAAADGRLSSPMPGRVTEVKVAVGEAVAKGQALLVIEAMKMENVLRAPRDGTVRAVLVEAGARVAPGQMLVDIV